MLRFLLNAEKLENIDSQRNLDALVPVTERQCGNAEGNLKSKYKQKMLKCLAGRYNTDERNSYASGQLPLIRSQIVCLASLQNDLSRRAKMSYQN